MLYWEQHSTVNAIRGRRGRGTLGELAGRLLSLLRSRHAAGQLSLSHLARLTHYSQPYLSLIIHGHRSMTIDAADAIMLALQLTIEDLTAEPPQPPPPIEIRPPRVRTPHLPIAA